MQRKGNTAMKFRQHATLTDWMNFHAAKNPANAAIAHANTTISYGDLWDKVLRLSTGLQNAGLQKSDIVGVQLPNIAEYVITFLAVASCGAIVQTLHMPYQRAERQQLLAHSGAKMAVCLSSAREQSPAEQTLEVAKDLPNLEKVIAVGEPVEGTISFADLMMSEPTPDLPDLTPDDPFLLLYTSGTTASPKGVPHNYRGFLGNAKRSADEFDITPDDRLMSAAPFTHLYGLYVLHLALASGACNQLLPIFDPANFLPALESEKPTALFSAPAHFAPFVAAGKLEPNHLNSIRFLCLSGAPVPPELAKSVDALMANGNVIQLWGMSELQAGTFGRPGDPLETRLTTAGRATPGTSLRVVDENGIELTVGKEGELEVKGPSIFSGYLNNEQETKSAFTRDGWFRTGDLATIDANGYMKLTGRVKEIINRGGIKYNPIDIELLLMKMPQIEMCAIIPYPDDVLGERACLCVLLKENSSLTLADVTTYFEAQNISKYKWPERVEIVKEMPMTPTKKVMRGVLKEMFG